MRILRATCGLGALALLLGMTSAASAQWGFGGYGGGYGYGYGFGEAYSMNPPPYFAMFPPVYYSGITPRPYGFSPFAYPPGVMTPQPSVVSTGGYRRYARRPVASRASTASAPRPAPVIIENPFVLPAAERPSRLSDGRPLPQVIEPSDALAHAAAH